ncbi:unnamed protein product [Chilo suppressalis]|uniref:Uncharacterized protein n=1 Tax=Chilo suppressalis TaxID=168631 RepID=A0ABN8AXP3_CHISP|nr:hypothetical protein evm_014245 [Chilo suppressalis]CAH0400258.1 unnamed protein product [Chilo suppressalis]
MALQLPRFTRCCFCLSLRTGSLIVGYISIVVSLLFMAAISFFLYHVVMFVNHNQNQSNPEHSPEELAQVALGVYVSQAFYLLVFLFLLIINIMLVVGVHTDKPRLLRIYTYSGFFLFGMSIGLVVVSMVFVGFLATLPLLKWCFINFLCLLLVRSTYLDMEERNKPRVYEMQTLYSPQQAPLTA